jgi:hypothetical protein
MMLFSPSFASKARPDGFDVQTTGGGFIARSINQSINQSRRSRICKQRYQNAELVSFHSTSKGIVVMLRGICFIRLVLIVVKILIFADCSSKQA